ncbi:MAG: hypothetical protein ACRDKW_07740, partial [Actinomycetota bacterium]
SLHGMIARVLEAGDADPSELARHLIGAGDVASAASALDAAARQRLERYANKEADRLAGAGLDLDPAPALLASLLETRSEARARQGDYAAARTDLRRLLTAGPPRPARARALVRLAELTSGAEDYDRAGGLVELALTESGGDPQARARALAAAAVFDLNRNRIDRARERSDEALRLFEELGDAFGAATVLDVRALRHFFEGRLRVASDLFDRVATLFSDAGALLQALTPRGMRALCLVFADEPERAHADSAEVLNIVRAAGMGAELAAALWVESEAFAVAGDAEKALARAQEALEVAGGWGTVNGPRPPWSGSGARGWRTGTGSRPRPPSGTASRWQRG